MSGLIRVIAAAGAVFIDGDPRPVPAGTLEAALDGSGTTITISNVMGGAALACGPWQTFAEASGNAFASSTAAMAYLSATLAMQPSMGDTFTETFTAAAPIFGGYAVMFTGSGQVEHADPTSAGYVFAGIATQSSAAGAATAVRRRDIFGFSAWAWTQGEPVFALPGGVLTQAPPDTGVSHQIGAALDPVTLSIEPHDPVYL